MLEISSGLEYCYVAQQNHHCLVIFDNTEINQLLLLHLHLDQF